ncbi:dynein regulatory complex subunit 2-like [Diprion similis]|uniref:dynein regulatory complex subunit 2-like n=1 Tax=Diprion similis TaxID=362088 RepID=UPI001EF7E998|nr:dynein regulatory complex subunit 2-like [Diprion similis]
MPAKKKKGKASKLSRMSDEERARYLQHRAEIELEAKRRKQQLIAAFTKNKLKHEEAFSRLNTAKINEQWRHLLRQIKCKELYQDVKHLWQNFDATLKAKNSIIAKLYDELELSDRDHRRSQEAHIMTIDKFIGELKIYILVNIHITFPLRGNNIMLTVNILSMSRIVYISGIHKQRLSYLHDNYAKELRKLEYIGTVELTEVKNKLENSCKEQDTIIFAQNKSLESSLEKTRSQNAIHTRTIVHSKEEDIMELRQRVVGNMEHLWSQLLATITDYEVLTENKRKQYEYLKEQDDAVRAEAAMFPKQQSQLLDTIDITKGQLDDLAWERGEQITELKQQLEQLNKAIWDLRSKIKMAQITDAIQLKKLSVISNGVKKELDRILEKGTMLQLLSQLCSSLEEDRDGIDKCSNKDKELLQCYEKTGVENVTEPFDRMEKFWKQFNEVKAENILRRKERVELLQENRHLRHSLRVYLVTVARMPAARPHTAI